jgi:hypothetical protein
VTPRKPQQSDNTNSQEEDSYSVTSSYPFAKDMILLIFSCGHIHTLIFVCVAKDATTIVRFCYFDSTKLPWKLFFQCLDN